MLARRVSALLLLCVLAALPFLGSCNSSSITTPAVCAISPTALGFGSVPVGLTADRTITVKNTGGGTLTGTVSVTCNQYSLVGSGSYSVAGGDSAHITVRFSPTDVGVFPCTIATGCDSVHVTGTGIVNNTPACSVTPASLNFGTVTVGQTADRTFTIKNIGGGTLTGTATTSTCPGYSITGTASYSLAHNETATITVRFAPGTPGAPARPSAWDRVKNMGRVAPADLGVLTCSVNPGTGCSAVDCSGTAEAAPTCQVSAASLDFGSVTVGQFSEKTFTITNAGGGTLTGGVSTSGCTGFSVTGSATYSLTAAQSKTFTIRFAPTSVGKPSRPQVWEKLKGWMVRPLNAGLQSCTVTTGCTSTVSASGTGIAASACQVNPTSLTFGSVPLGQHSDLPFSITNNGGGTLSGTVSTGSCAGFSIVGDATYSLAASASKIFTVRYAPTGAGLHTCNVSSGTGCASVNASGTGQLAPACLVNKSSLDFGSVTVGLTKDLTFDITNSGGGTLTGTVNTSGCSGFSVVGDASYSLGAGLSKTFTIRFAPTSAGKPANPQLWERLKSMIGRPQHTGVQTCTVNTGCTASVSASGTGVAAAAVCNVNPITLTFGSVNVGEHQDRTFTITNNGTSTLAGTVSLSCADFSIVGDASYSLAATQAKIFTIRYAPTSPGGRTCNIATGGTCSAVSASATGVSAVTCTPSSLTGTFGTWLEVDTTYSCTGAVQSVTRDTIVICASHSITDLSGSDSTFICTVTKCTSSQYEAECNGQITADSCSISYDIKIRGTFSGNTIRSVATINTVATGKCFGFGNQCTIIGGNLTRISSDTTDCGVRSGGGGGGGSVTMSCKIDGAAWASSAATGLMVTSGGSQALTLSGVRTSDGSGINLVLDDSPAITAKTYDQDTGAMGNYSQGTSVFLGSPTSITVTSLNTAAKTIAGTFSFTATNFVTSATKTITDGTFSGSYTTFGSPEWLMSHRARYRPSHR